MIDRAGPSDVAMLAMGTRGSLAQRAGAILLLEPRPGFEVARASRLLAAWIRSVPRLRRRLVRVPFGCGRPVWVDDPGFDVRLHVREMACPAPGDERALLDVAAAVLVGPSPPSRWAAVFVTGLSDGAVALIVVLDHVLADGIGGLALLAALADPGRRPEPGGFPQPPPSLPRLAADAFAERLRALGRVRAYWQDARTALTASGGLRPAPVARCSLLRPTGPRRTFAVVRADLVAVRDAAHREGCTVNDALLTAVTGALRELLRRRGEHVEALSVSVPVSARSTTTSGELGNRFGVLIAALPVVGDAGQRMRRIASLLAERKKAAGQASAANLFGPLFRLLAALGLYRRYLRRQLRIHTLVSNVRGPDRTLTFADAAIREIIPVAVAESGNVTVSFEILSYDGTIVITLIADPDNVPDLDALAALLREELAGITAGGSPAGRPSGTYGPHIGDVRR
ncbi:wax ester/triacylglycerol synthase domain-containing protein [Nonomuraea sp. NPDC048826]|uniref:wax ester/triacylglycerol synthase domain-containing protein n=1 Tax=Nonomuraea sp. NPDC048826 TaxID=3364347 RepID=UPI0037144DDE